MSQLSKLKAATSLSDVARILKVKPKTLAYVLHGIQDSAKYTVFEIPKKTGGARTISAPVKELKYVQSQLAEVLNACIEKINEEKEIKNALSHGFRPGFSILTNGLVHRNREYVFNLDLKDFFGTINFGRVRGYFIKNKNFALHSDVATVLAQIACHEGKLPQGAPCSPAISNLIGHILDIKLAELAKKTGCSYSRYADDLTFSTNKVVFPSQIAKQEVPSSHEWTVADKLSKTIEREQFTINADKTRMQYRNSRQLVTGLVVNKKVNVRHEYNKKVRTQVRHLIKTGKYHHVDLIKGAGGEVIKTETEGTFDQLNGMLSFIDWVGVGIKKSVDISDEHKHRKFEPEKLSMREKTYRQFLHFKNFYSNSTPVIICEGKTDNIYIPCAIRSLVATFPDLAEKQPDGSVKSKVKFFKYSKLTQRLLGLLGGTGQMATLMSDYAGLMKEFEAPGLLQPVIIVVDHDEGIKGILSTAGNLLKKPVDGSLNYYFICKNLYLVTVPKITGSDTAMEDLFDPKLLKTLFLGKKFNPISGYDRKTEYGKSQFAEHVVAKHQGTIDFSGFKPLLERIVAAIHAHQALVKKP